MRPHRNLTDEAFKATMSSPVRDVTQTATDVIDIWPYARSVPAEDLHGHTLWDDFIEAVYRSSDNRFDHVLAMTRTRNVYLVIVVDLIEDSIYGHRLLDLNREYGLV